MAKTVTENRSFSYRCFKKDFNKFHEALTITPEFHFERGEGDEVIVVEDRPKDWVEIANQDVGKVGLANILKLAAKGQIDISQCAYNSQTEGGLDVSEFNTMDPESIKSQISSIDELTKKVEELQKQVEAAKAAQPTSEGVKEHA